MFIGREKELQFLEDQYALPDGQLIVLYGRRRIGKTETLHQFCKNKTHVFYSCIQSSDAVQLRKFSSTLLRQDIPARKYLSSFSEWESAFLSILELPNTKEKKLIVLDEFPYMVQSNPSIPSILQNLWDTYFKENNVMMILCGSAMSFMEKELLAEKNPLYGRATGIYKMKEMNFYEASQFFPNYSAMDKILAYSILGGVPHYLRQWNPDWSVEENIQKNILRKGCVLYSEVEFLLHQELRQTPIYNSVIEAVALGSTKLNEISQNSLIDSTAKTSVYLKNLIELGLIEKEFSIDAKTKEKGNSGRGSYHLTDHFFRFWYTFAYGSYSQLEDGDAQGVYTYEIAPKLHQFASIVFEEICREYLRFCQKKNALPFRFSQIGRWYGKTTIRDSSKPSGVRIDETEIDVMAFNADRKKYLVGECKFKASAFRYSDYLNLKAKLQPEQKRAEFYYVLFSQSGFEEKIEQEKRDGHLLLVTMEQIVGNQP